MANIIQLLDSSAIGIGPAAVNLKRGLREQSLFSAIESIFEMGGAVSTLTNYCGKTLANLPVIWAIFTSQLPSIIGVLGVTMNSGPARDTLGVIGIVTGTFRFFREGISLLGQRFFLAIFQKHAWKGLNMRNALAEAAEKVDQPAFQKSLPLRFRNIIVGKKEKLKELLSQVDAGDQTAFKKAETLLSYWTGRDIRDRLQEIKSLPLVAIERTLPVWLYQDIVIRGGKDYLNLLFQKVSSGDQKATIEATQLLDQMQSYATKKQIVHVLRMIGAVLGIIASLAFFITFPFALTIALTIIMTVLSASAYLVNAGYIENREDGFSLKICIPEFVRNMPSQIASIPEQINGFIEGGLKKKPIVSSYQLLEQYQLAKATMPRQIERIRSYSKERIERQARIRMRAMQMAASAA